MLRHIIHIHIPAFLIIIERANRSELRNRPVAIASAHSGRSIILSVFSEVRKEGIFKGMALGKALKFCPDLKVLPPSGAHGKGVQGPGSNSCKLYPFVGIVPPRSFSHGHHRHGAPVGKGKGCCCIPYQKRDQIPYGPFRDCWCGRKQDGLQHCLHADTAGPNT